MRRFLPLVAVLSLGFAPVPFPRAKPADLTDLQKMKGSWTVSSRRLGQEEMFIPPEKVVTVEITGDCIRYYRAGKMMGEYKLVLNEKSIPKTWNATIVKGSDSRFIGRTLKAIYTFKGETFIMRHNVYKPFDERPQNFDSKNERYIEKTFTRKKP